MSPGSLSEGAGSPQGLTEGVSSDGCSMPTIYTPAIINSVIFYRLRSPKYTPSVSHSLDSPLREGAGNGCVPFNVPPGNREVAGDFHRPYESSDFFTGYVHRRTLPQSRPLGVTAPSEREPGGVRTIQCTARKRQGCGRFSSPLRRLRVFYISPFNRHRFPPGKRYRVGQGTGVSVESSKRN